MTKVSIGRLILPVIFFFISFAGKSFSILTHEAIIDAAWEKAIVPFLKNKFPLTTTDGLNEAHAYAYGGAVAPDMGYYPRNSKFFTDLVHYVRSGDMINALFANAKNANDYAFAIGFLSHYNADRYGHPLATNICVPLTYPKLQKKYGSAINYEQDKTAHVRMEFGFDVLQVAKGNYASQAYRNFIGFKVDTALLSTAFSATYGLDINKVFDGHFNRAVETFRWIVANIFPLITKSAWAAKKNAIRSSDSTVTASKFRFKMRQRNYNKIYGRSSSRPGMLSAAFSLFVKVLPKIGPLKVLKFKVPTPESEKYFDRSFDTVVHFFRADLDRLQYKTLQLADIDFDTGDKTTHCEYVLAEEAYQQLLETLQRSSFESSDEKLRENILEYYRQTTISASDRRSKGCVRFFEDLDALRKYKTNLQAAAQTTP